MPKGGICPVCNRMKPLDKAGKIKRHNAPERGPVSGQCSGTGQSPKHN